MWSRILARVLEGWLRQDRPDGISDGYCDLLGCVQRLLRAPTKTLIHSAAVGRAFSWVALSAGAQWVGAVDDDGCRGDSGAQLLLEQQSVVVRLLVLEVSTVSEDALLSLCSLRGSGFQLGRTLSWGYSSWEHGSPDGSWDLDGTRDLLLGFSERYLRTYLPMRYA